MTGGRRRVELERVVRELKTWFICECLQGQGAGESERVSELVCKRVRESDARQAT